jgi:polysaccharide export outer membrane protein
MVWSPMNRTNRVCTASGGAAHLSPYGAGTESGVRSLNNDKSPGMIMRTIVMLLFVMTSAVAMNGCEVDSFFNPSVTGYYESTPSSMPILTRIDVIERETGFTPDVTKPTAEDLVPNELVYRVAPGDVVRVEIYELVSANQTDVSVRVIDQAGSIRLPTLGDIQAAGLTVDELQERIIKRLTELISDPLVTVVLEDGRSFQFTIYGAVAGTGLYALTRPDFRIMDALSLAGGTASTTQKIMIIREVAIDEAVRPGYERSDGVPDAASDGTGENDVSDIDALIDALGGDAASPSAMSQSDEPPVDVDDLKSVSVEDRPGATPGTDRVRSASSQEASGDAFVFDEDRQEWVRISAEEVAELERSGGAIRPNTDRESVAEIQEQRVSPYATRIIELDYQALARGDSNLNVVIRPGDRVFIDTPEIGVVYIDGEINRPGVYQLPIAGKLTLSRLVAAAGGLNPIAIPERVDFTRKISADREATLRVNLAAIRNRAEPDIFMRRDDHVHIGTNFFAAPLAVIRNGFRFTYGFGFLLDRNFGNDVFGPPPTNIGNGF